SATLSIVLAIVVASCSHKNENKLPDGVGLNLSNMDTTVSPSDDFFRFVNGGWVDQHEIPRDLGRYGSFDELAENTRTLLLEILRKAGEDDEYKDGSDQRKAIDF